MEAWYSGNPLPFRMWQFVSHEISYEMGKFHGKDGTIQEMWHDEVKFNCFPAEREWKKYRKEKSQVGNAIMEKKILLMLTEIGVGVDEIYA